jgi:hypothetical protein
MMIVGYKFTDADLLNDKKLIIMLQAIGYCGEHNTGRIQYSILKRLCNEKLSELTHGKNTDFGGQFEKLLVTMSDAEDINKRFLSRERLSKKKSFIYPDIQKIESYLVRTYLGLSSRISWDYKDVDRETLEKAYRGIATGNSKKIIPRLKAKANSYERSQHEYMKEAAIEMATYLSSHFINVSYFHPSGKAFILDEDTLTYFFGGSERVSSKIGLGSPFKIIIEYRGVPEVTEDEDGISTGLKYANKLCDIFVPWARRFHHYEIQEFEKQYIRENRVERLSKTTRQYLDEFRSIFLKYSLPKGHGIDIKNFWK